MNLRFWEWSRIDWSHFYWYGFFLLIAFLPAEILGFKNVAPWTTFSGTVQHDIHDHRWFGIVTLAVVLGLLVHFLYDRKLEQSLLFGLVIAVAAHLLDKSWP